ncbi:hypothetical protein [Bradyrhizobium brasilense]|uniref:hypothetical protein n=1 Tax=Bradyrhizobium brasilense TaxID=1419277 RepID=UPI000B86E66F|nr:hypothetical protein [Bradyrhizobium brasilense]
MTTDFELRGEVLKATYDRRLERGGFVQMPMDTLRHIPIKHLELVCRQLDEHGLINWKGHIGGGGMARITARGVDVIEQNTEAPIAMNIFVGSSSHIHNVASGTNSRVNTSSTDNSTNINVSGDVFGDLTAALKSGVADQDRLAQLLTLVEEMQKSQKTPGFAATYQKFVSLCADHLGIVIPFLPALTTLF